MTRFQLFLLAVLLFLALFIRIYKIDKVPSGVYIDEADYGLQARSLLENFKDYQGERSPFWVHSFNDIRTPIPVYFTVFTTLIFNIPELEVRAPSVFLGTLVVLVVFLLVKLWTKNFLASFFIAAVFAFSPWQIQFSRFAHEGMSTMAIYLSAIYFFFKALEKKSYGFLIIFTILLSLAVYAYRTMGLFVPLTFAVLFLLFWKELLPFGFRKLGIVVVSAAIIILPFLYATTLGAPDQPRIAQLSITSDPEVPIFVQIGRSVDTGVFADPSTVKKPTPFSMFFHNKLLSWLDSFFNNYFQTFSDEFLFIKGDINQRHSVGQMGHLYTIDILALIFGVIFLAKSLKNKAFVFLIFWLLIAPIPSSLTIDGAKHAARLFNLSAPLLILVGLGWWHFFENVKKINHLKLPIFSFVGALWILLFIFYLHRYFVHFPAEAASSFGYGFKQAIQKIVEVEKDYKRIAMVSSKDPPVIYFLYWSEADPRLIQEYGINFSQEVIKNHPFDKYKVVDWPPGIGSDPEVARYLSSDTLYLVSKNELPQDFRSERSPEGIKLVDIIKYPDREVAFYLVTKDPSYKAPNTAPRFKGIAL